MPLGCAGVKYGCAESAQNHAFLVSVHLFDTKNLLSKKNVKFKCQELSECGPEQSGVYILSCPENSPFPLRGHIFKNNATCY